MRALREQTTPSSALTCLSRRITLSVQFSETTTERRVMRFNTCIARALDRIASIVLSLFLIADSLAAKEPSFVPLFDGKSLDGWTLVEKKGPGYTVKDGNLACPKDGGGNLFTVKEFANFVFRFEFRTEPAGNNGVGIRSPLTGDAAYQGMEIQILDTAYDKPLKPTQYHGSIYDVVPAKRGFLKKAGEWNKEEI